MNLFISVGEPSGDLHGAGLIKQLLEMRPDLKIGGVLGPRMREFAVQEFFPMEDLLVMGFIDVLFAMPKIVRQFYAIRNKILELKPQAVVCIDYPGFHLRLERSLRKKGYKGKLIHYICPTVWAWEKRTNLMAQNLDLLLTIFPFEKECFKETQLPVAYVGHPLTQKIDSFKPSQRYMGQKILSLFPGSRKEVIARNLPIQMAVAKKLQALDPTLKVVISNAKASVQETYDLMRASHLAIATSGTVTLELALHGTPTVVGYAIRPLDCFIAQKIFRIRLPFYCIVNIAAGKEVFPELFGPNLTEDKLFSWGRRLWFDEQSRNDCITGCKKIKKILDIGPIAQTAAASKIFEIVS